MRASNLVSLMCLSAGACNVTFSNPSPKDGRVRLLVVVDVVVGDDGVVASFPGLEVDPVPAGVVAPETLSKYQAAARPSCPLAVRTRTH